VLLRTATFVLVLNLPSYHQECSRRNEQDSHIFPFSHGLLVRLSPQVLVNSDGKEVELKEGGRNIPVTYENRLEFVKLAEDYK